MPVIFEHIEGEIVPTDGPEESSHETNPQDLSNMHSELLERVQREIRVLNEREQRRLAD